MNRNASPRGNETETKIGRREGARGTTGGKGGDARRRTKRGNNRGKDPADELDDGSAAMQDRVQIAKAKSDTRRLSLSGSRTHLAQLKPKKTKRLLQRGERESSDSGVDHNVSPCLELSDLTGTACGSATAV